jgi:hypothetical protein
MTTATASRRTAAGHLNPRTVYDVIYQTAESAGQFRGYWTGAIDPWGRMVFARCDGEAMSVYLYPSEVVARWTVPGITLPRS